MPVKIFKTNSSKSKLIVSSTLCVLIFYCCKLMFSSVLSIRPETHIISWEKKKEPINVELAISFIKRLESSIAINPYNAKSNFLLARLYELLAFQKSTTNKGIYLINAQNAYKKAIINQPSWDIAWARLATLNSKNNNKEQALYSLKKALYLGPYEDKNQSIIIPLIIKYWNNSQFLQNNKLQIIKIFSHVLKFKKNNTLLLNSALQSQNLNLLRFVAPLIKHEYQLKQYNKYILSNNLKVNNIKPYIPNE